MKKALSLLVICSALFGATRSGSAATTNIYVQDWGTVNGGASVTGNGTLNLVGWTVVAVSQTTGPYVGIYQATGASDGATGEPLPVNTVYFTVLTPTQTTPGMFYTTDTSGPGTGGDSSFAAIDPTQHTNLAFSVEVRGAATETNYFAVRMGTQWYVSTFQLPGSGGLGYPQFANAVMPFTNTASAWRTLTINATDVTIGSAPGSNLSGLITGIGIVELPTGGGFNYNRLAVTAFVPGGGPPPTPPSITSSPINQTVYAGGGASFLLLAAGTPPLTYIWKTNGVAVAEGSKYSGTTNNVLTIFNATAADAAMAYSVVVTNAGGAVTNSGFTLTVNPVPGDFLYAESFPYVGPNGNLPITGVGWEAAFQGVTGIYSSGPGIGNVFSYSGVATTNIYYATTNDNGSSGLAFAPINPDAVPGVTFQANFTPGNGASLNPSNVVAYWAVQMQDGSWYSSAKPVPVQTITLNNYQPYQMAFSRFATNWNNLTINANTATIGGAAGGNLSGNITGVGIVMAHLGLNGGGDFNFNTFVLTTNAVTVLPPTIGVAGAPYSQTVPSGGGVSFGVSATGQLPFTYGWTLNGVPLVDGGRISGATSPTLTIANLTSADNGTIVAFVTNSVGVDESDFYVGTSLSVTSAPIGTLYVETFPFVGPLPANYPIASEGWVEAAPGAPNALYQTIGSDAAVFAFIGSAATTVYYATRASDTNQAGLQFPDINLASYPDLSISVDIAPQFNAANVTAYLAVQLNGGPWYVASSALPVPTTDSPVFSTYTTAFNPAAANWKNLTVSGSGGLIGSTATSNLGGVMTGFGLVFVTTGAGGTHNFDNILITASGLGAINLGTVTGSNVTLSWVGNPAVNLQSTTNLASPVWLDVPNSAGAYSLPVSLTLPQRYFRLKGVVP
jgi:Ig-like domain-containing protein/immunoglobulin I-set domain protein